MDLKDLPDFSKIVKWDEGNRLDVPQVPEQSQTLSVKALGSFVVRDSKGPWGNGLGVAW